MSVPEGHVVTAVACVPMFTRPGSPLSGVVAVILTLPWSVIVAIIIAVLRLRGHEASGSNNGLWSRLRRLHKDFENHYRLGRDVVHDPPVHPVIAEAT